MEQRSDEWFKIRMGKFTASSIHKLLSKPTTKTFQDYILEKAAEELGAENDNPSSKAMRWGNDHEDIAIELYEHLMGVKVQRIGFKQLAFTDQAGCSPDGFIPELGKGIEIKCPFNIVNHMDNLTIKDQNTFKSKRKEYYWQIQMCMMCFGVSEWDFVSYDPRFDENTMITRLTIKADPADQAKLANAIREAILIKEEILKSVK